MDRKVFLSIWAMMAVASSAAKAEDYSVSQLVDLALSRSKQVEAANLDSKSHEMDAAQAAVWENPNLEIATENKDEAGGSTRQWKAGLSQTIGIPGRYALRGEAASADYKISKIEAENTGRSLRYEVFTRTFEYLAAEEHVKHAQERLTRFKDVQSYISSRTFASPQKKAEANIVTGKLLVLDKEFLKLRAEADSAWENLNLFLGLGSKPIIRATWYRQGKNYSLNDLKEKLLEKNPELARQKLVVEKSEVQTKLSKNEAWPAFTVSGSYGNGSGYAPEKTYGVALSFPIPSFNTNSAGIRASQFRQQAEISRLGFEQDQVFLKLKNAWLRYEMARSSIQHLPVNRIPEFEKSMSVTDQGFRKGQIDLLTYIEADSQHSESLDAIYAAQTEYVSYLSTLLAMVGDATIPEETSK